MGNLKFMESDKNKKIKLYFHYAANTAMKDWYHCTAILENGCVLASHICSHPGFMFGDLWDNRPERQKTMKELGYEVEPIYIQLNNESLNGEYKWLLDAYNEFGEECQNKFNKEYEELRNTK